MRDRYDFSKGKRNPYAKRLKKQVIIGVPTLASIHFPNVDGTASSIASLQLNLHAPRGAKAEFRNVPILP